MIRMNNIRKVYTTGSIAFEALKDVAFEVDKGEFVAIIGPSGSGKSTLMNIIGCLDVATEGAYELDGVDIRKAGDKKLAKIRNEKIGFVFQSFNLLSKLTALENVELPLIYLGYSARKRRVMAKEALVKVGLEDKFHNKPTEMSGGQKQRVAIARAIVSKPAVILADEPTGNLDSRTTEEVLTLFKELNHEGNTIVMITHEMEVAEETGRIVKIKDGHIVEDYPVFREAAYDAV